jgi:uncharacterized protein (TIGR02996 family)
MIGKTAFENQVHADPDDDTVRLVFADWLDENGDPGRAKFVRLQIECSKTVNPVPEDDATLGLLYDAMDLLDSAEARGVWWPYFVGTSPYFKVRPEGGDAVCVEYEVQHNSYWQMNKIVRFRRGFPDMVFATTQDLVGGNACQWCSGKGYVKVNRRHGNGTRRSGCPECRGKGVGRGLFDYVAANPIENISVYDCMFRIEVEPPGEDYGWQAYWYPYGHESYSMLVGGNDSRAELFGKIREWLENDPRRS